MYQQTAPRRSPVSGVKRNKKGVVIEGIAREGVKLVEGETLEHTIRRMVAQNEPIKSEVMLIMDPIGEEMASAYDIRNDRFDTMIHNKDKVIKMAHAGREKQAKDDAAKAAGEETE